MTEYRENALVYERRSESCAAELKKAEDAGDLDAVERWRELMRATYTARAAEKAAQTGRCDGMKPAPVTPGVGRAQQEEK